MIKSLVTLILSAGTVLAQDQVERAIRYDWSFPQGNLIANWSFENEEDEACASASSLQMQIDCHYPFSSAPSGSRVMFASLIAANPSTNAYPHRTNYVRVEEGANYSLSVQVNLLFGSLNALGKIRPAVEFLNEGKQALDTVLLDFYGQQLSGTTGEWQSYAKDFAAPSGATFARISLVSFAQTEDCALLFDNFLVSPETNPAFVERRVYADAAGNAEKDVIRDPTNDVVRFTTYDAQRRPVRSYVPVFGSPFLPSVNPDRTQLPLFTVGANSPPNSTVQDFPTLDEAYAALTSWAAARTAGQIGAQDLRIVVVTDANDADVETSSDITTVMSGDPVPVELEFAVEGIYRGSLEYLELLASISPLPSQPSPPPSDIPSSFDNPEDVVSAGTFARNYPGESHFFSEASYPNPGVNTFGEMALPGNGYELSQGKTDKDGWAYVADTTLLNNLTPSISELEITSSSLTETDPEPYLYQWSRDRQGNYSVSFTNAKGLLEKEAAQKNGGWLTTAYLYDGFNRLVKTTSPEGKEIQVTFFDGQNHATRVVDPDRGTIQSVYDDRGRQRFTKNSANSYFTAVKYDFMDRALGVAKITDAGGFIQVNADNPDYPATSALEQGNVYDELTDASFNVRTGLLPGAIGLDLTWIQNTQGKVVMAYKRNQDATVAGMTAADKLVACFYSYDDRNRLSARYEYVGPSPAGHKWHKIEYFYDEQDRLNRRVLYKDVGTIVAQAAAYQYDVRGRVSKVVDETGTTPEDAAVYTYDPLDRTLGVSLHNNVQMAYGYDIQGKPLSIEGDAGGKNVFAEYLGYEGLAHPQLPTSAPAAAARFDGKIGSTLVKYSLGALGANPVEYKTFAYQQDGPLSETKRYQGSGLNMGTGEIDFTHLPFNSAPTQTLDYAYENDGGLSGQSIDNATGNDVSQAYAYQTGKHQLSSVTKTEGTVSATSNFTYDGEGRLTNQTGPNSKTLNYDFFGMPVNIIAGNVKQDYFYGPDNFRVATYTANASTSTIIQKKVYVFEEGLTVAKEIRENGGTVKTRVHLYGQDGLIGVMDEDSGAKRFLVKDHLGSIVQVVSDNALTQDENFFADYGELSKKVGSADVLNPSEGWTGKEYDVDIGLTYFGARFYDPQLGVWLGPDPAAEFFNPWSYVGGDPINFRDLWGLLSDGWHGSQFWYGGFCNNCAKASQAPPIQTQSPTQTGGTASRSTMGSSSKAGHTASAPTAAGNPGIVPGANTGAGGGGAGTGAGPGGGGSGGGYYGPGFFAGEYPSFTQAVQLGRDITMELMLIHGGKYVKGEGFSTTPADVFAWAGAYAANTVFNSIPITPGEGALAAVILFLHIPKGGGGSLVAGEAGAFSELEARGVVGDALTPHHMPQAALGFTSRGEGGALAMTAGEHAQTRTYGALGRATAKAELGLPFRQVLARDIRDVRSIVGSKYNKGLQDLIQYYNSNFPTLMR